MVKTLIVFSVLLSGCAGLPRQPVENPRQVWCDHNSPRRDARADTPRKEIDEINTHNRRGTKWCGWRP